jgi:hypothetical protein
MAGDSKMDMLDGMGMRRRRKRAAPRKRAGDYDMDIIDGRGEGVRRRKRVAPRKRVVRRRAGDDCGGDDCGGARRRVRRRRAGDYDMDIIDGRGEGMKKRKRVGHKRSSPWIAYVKKYAKAHNMDYGQALSKAGPSYRKMHH